MNGLGNSRNVSLALRRRSAQAEAAVKAPPAPQPGGICDLAVHLDGSAEDEDRIAFAERLAVSFGARVEACLTQCFVLSPLASGIGGGWAPTPLDEGDLAPGGSAERRLRARIAAIDAETHFHRYAGMAFELGQSLARRARTVDLVVLGRPYGAAAASPEFLEAVLFNAAAAVLVVPPSPPRQPHFRNVVIGWKDTLECSRAIAAALPILRKASKVFLVSVDDGAEVGQGWALAADMAIHLSNHGIAVDVRTLPPAGDTARSLLDEARSVGADLLVTGAYGRSRLSEMILGGVTRHLLAHSTVPLLLMH